MTTTPSLLSAANRYIDARQEAERLREKYRGQYLLHGPDGRTTALWAKTYLVALERMWKAEDRLIAALRAASQPGVCPVAGWLFRVDEGGGLEAEPVLPAYARPSTGT